ncbi:hypothetical protein Cni_G29428 [Canna indica]|uniref:Uncharacterized protein n=1 Tax=Canna indica TaxID=4628 RepID=A0AAQ3QTL6_9LILI|nr:hypothetical protein Cni_G29428 [Canna indica]
MLIGSSAEKGERAAGVADCSAADPQPSSNAQPPLERRLLHDFSFPTLNLRWGGQRILPCVKIPDGATTSEDGEDGVHRSPQMRSSKGGDARGTEAEKASPSFVTTAQRTDLSIDIHESVIEKELPNETTYIIIVEGIAHEDEGIVL